MRRLPAYLYVADLVPGKRVLEVECGDAAGAAFLASCGAARVLAVDGSREQVDRARRHHRLANLELRWQDPARLELEDGSIDLVFIPDATRLVRRREALDELRRVLAPGGWLIACAASADRPAAAGGLSYREIGERLQPLFAPVRVAAQSPFVGVTLCEYAAGDSAPPPVQLDRTLVDPARAAEVTGYLAICGGRPGPARPLSLVELPRAEGQVELARGDARQAVAEPAAEPVRPAPAPAAVAPADVALAAELAETRRKLDRVTDNWKQAEAKNDDVWRRVGELQTELGQLREQTMESARRQRQQAQVDLARALEKSSVDLLTAQERQARAERETAELRRDRERLVGLLPRLEQELVEARAVVVQLEAAVVDLHDKASAGGGADRSLALELGVREAELAFLGIGLSSLQARVREAAAQVSDVRRAMQGRGPDEVLALIGRIEQTLRELA